MEINKIKYNLENTFHMLRHFSFLDEIMREQLLKTGKKKEEIEHELSEPGSRFHKSFANTIQDILNRMQECTYTEELSINGNKILKVKANPMNFPGGVGTLNVVPIVDIPVEKRDKIFFKKNRATNLMHYKIEKLPNTNEFTVIVKPQQEFYYFITAFPGESGMPLPDPSMNAEIYKKCKSYWDAHVFLIHGAEKNEIN